MVDVVIVTPDHRGAGLYGEVAGNEGILRGHEIGDRAAACGSILLPAESPIPNGAALQMASGAASAVLRSSLSRPIRSVGDILPFPIADFLVLASEPHLLPLHENRPERIRTQAPVCVELETSVRVPFGSPALKEHDRPVGESVPPGRGRCLSVGPNDPDMALIRPLHCEQFG